MVNADAQTTGLFSRYRVISTKIKIVSQNNEAFSLALTTVVVPSALTGGYSASNYANDLRQQPGAVTSLMTRVTLPGMMAVQRRRESTAQLEHGMELGNANYLAAYNASPGSVNLIYYQFNTLDGANLLTAAGISLAVEFEFLLQGVFPNLSLDG
jgi:hypothetical protein